MISDLRIAFVTALLPAMALPISVRAQEQFSLPTYVSSPMLLLPLDAVSAPSGIAATASFNDRSPTAYGLNLGLTRGRVGLSAEGVAGHTSGIAITDADGWYSAGSLALTISIAPELMFFVGAQADHESWGGATRKGFPAGFQLAPPFKIMALTLTPIALVGAAVRFDNKESISTPIHEASDGTWRDGFFVGAAARFAWRNVWAQMGWQWSKQWDGRLGAATPAVPIMGGAGFVPAQLQMAPAAALRVGYSVTR